MTSRALAVAAMVVSLGQVSMSPRPYGGPLDSPAQRRRSVAVQVRQPGLVGQGEEAAPRFVQQIAGRLRPRRRSVAPARPGSAAPRPEAVMLQAEMAVDRATVAAPAALVVLACVEQNQAEVEQGARASGPASVSSKSNSASRSSRSARPRFLARGGPGSRRQRDDRADRPGCGGSPCCARVGRPPRRAHRRSGAHWPGGHSASAQPCWSPQRWKALTLSSSNWRPRAGSPARSTA